MSQLRFTLLSDGGSERALLPLLRRLLEENLPTVALESNWAELRRLPTPPEGLDQRIRKSLALYPCDLLFVHRDAERQSPERRRKEILSALQQIPSEEGPPPVACVIPVRMQEAWLLVDEQAIRKAAGNPNGRDDLSLPRILDLEAKPNPKKLLHEALRTASGLRGVRRKRFPVHARAHRVSEHLRDLSVLRELPAFLRLEDELKARIPDLPIRLTTSRI